MLALSTSSTPSPDSAEQRLHAFWVGAGVLPADAVWTALSGGRTNPVWRVEGGGAPVVCKLFRADAGTPLFPNSPSAEVLALQCLHKSGIAPHLVEARETDFGTSLIYTYVEGKTWRRGVSNVARLLRRLHDTPPPDGLPASPTGMLSKLRQGQALLNDLGEEGDTLRQITPALPDDEQSASVFLHGDVVPGNLLQHQTGLTLIDWQCPTRGDACDDLAVFLSPAMQHVNGNPPLSVVDQARFLQAYGDPIAARRYRRLAPVYHWRMAAYCLWKARRGDQAYGPAAGLEMAQLQRTATS